MLFYGIDGNNKSEQITDFKFTNNNKNDLDVKGEILILLDSFSNLNVLDFNASMNDNSEFNKCDINNNDINISILCIKIKWRYIYIKIITNYK